MIPKTSNYFQISRVFHQNPLKYVTLIIILISRGFELSAQDSLKDDVVKITRSWDLPAVLQNISAIDYISPGKLACLQDEMGTIFIYDLEASAITAEFPFGPPGDYQGLAIVNNITYVACADGRILEITNLDADTPAVKEYGTHLTVAENISGLCFDKKNNRLLVSISGAEDANQHYKDIYSFNLATRSMPVKPVIRIDLANRVFKKPLPKNLQSVFLPSDLDINTANGLLYVIDGTRGQLLRMKTSNGIRDLKKMDKKKFFQPEGIMITPSGEIFIASKGERDQPGKLLLVRIK